MRKRRLCGPPVAAKEPPGPPMNMLGLLAQVRANQSALDGGPGPHEFVGVEYNIRIIRKWECARCRGTVDSHGRHWYELGRRHERVANAG